MINASKFIALVALAAALLAAGCGSDSETTALTKAQFIKKGDEICKKADEQQEALFQEYIQSNPQGLPSSKKAREELVVSLALPPLKAEAEGLAALAPPSGDEQQAKAIVGGLQGLVGKIEKDPALAMTNNPEKLADPIDKLAGEYGFKECAEVF